MLDRFPIDPEGWKFAAIAACIAIVLGACSTNLGWIGAILTVWCLLFFRDPDRVSPVGTDLILSPADGVVQQIVDCIPPEELDLGKKPLKRISIFMSVFDVHVNRSPISGTVEKVLYIPGKFFNATLDKASEHNERQAITVKTKNDKRIVFVQIAGLIARRIRCDISQGSSLKAGQRVGIIRFGSRLDIYLPEQTSVLVSQGQTMIAGESVLAKF